MGTSTNSPGTPPVTRAPGGTTSLQEYTFPHDRLQRRMKQPNKKPIVLVACGSFSPITTLHLQLFELSERYVQGTEFEIVGNYISPCSDGYGKSSLVPAYHRINMCALAIEERKSNVMIDEWEALRRDDSGRPIYTPTADVLKRLDEQLNDKLGGIETVDGDKVRARVIMLMGADLALTMGNPDVWAPSDLDILLGYYGGFIVERPTQCDIQDAIAPLEKYRDNIWVVPSFENDVSSTKVRAQIQNGERAMDLPKSVFEYIRTRQLYQLAPPKDTAPKDAPIPKTNGTTDHDTAIASQS